MKKKLGIIGSILSITILLTLMILSPSAVATTPVDAGDLLSEVQYGTPCTVNADATATGDRNVYFGGGNPVVVTADWILDNDCISGAVHKFRLDITIVGTSTTDYDEVIIGYGIGPKYDTGTLTASVTASPSNQIFIEIYTDVTHGIDFDSASASLTITLV